MEASFARKENPSFFESSCTGKHDEVIGSVPNEVVCSGQLGLLQQEIDTVHIDGWSKSLCMLPIFTEALIDNHLIYNAQTMPDKRNAQAYRHKQKGYRLFKEGYVRKVFVRANVLLGDSEKFLVKAEVAASMKQQLYKVYVHLAQKNGSVSYANCNCKSGKGGCCKHVAGALYTLWDYSNLGLKVVPEDLTCTQVAQKWHVPSKGARQTVNAVYFNELEFEKANFKRDQSGSRKRALVSGASKGYCATPEFAKEVQKTELEQLAKALRNSGKCQLLRAALEGNNYEPCTMFQTSCKKPYPDSYKNWVPESDKTDTPLINLKDSGFFDKFAGYVPMPEGKPVNQQCEQYIFQNVSIDSKKAKEIESETRGQSECRGWFTHRCIRSTASNFGRVLKQRERTDPSKLVKEITKQRSMSSSDRLPASLRYGRENESLAINKYCCARTNTTVLKTGLIVNPKHPWLGCRPDGMILSNEGNIEGCVEVKCPYTHRDLTLLEATEDKNFFLLNSDGPKLKRTHHYYYQCQGVMAITETPWIDFITYTKNDLVIERIAYDETLWQHIMLPKLNSFYFDNVLPYLVKQDGE